MVARKTALKLTGVPELAVVMRYSLRVSRPRADYAAYGGQLMEYPQPSITDLHRPTDCQFRFWVIFLFPTYFHSAFSVKKSLL